MSPSLEDKLDSLIAGQTRIEVQVEDFRKELLGDGQPGRIQRIESDVTGLGERTKALENSSTFKAGGRAAIAAIVSAFVALLSAVAQFFSGHHR